jgi:hypothetical protein
VFPYHLKHNKHNFPARTHALTLSFTQCILKTDLALICPCPCAASLCHGCLLTLVATGTEGSNSAVITHTDGMVKRSVNMDFNRPTFSILNPELTFTLAPLSDGLRHCGHDGAHHGTVLYQHQGC